MSDVEVLASVDGEICAVCGGKKRSGAIFCVTDYTALPLPARWPLARGVGDAKFPDNFRTWLRHLQLNVQRVRLLPPAPGEMPFRNYEEMYAAGYVFSMRGQCGASACLAPILFVRTPNRKLLALDEPELQPHRLTCKDPEWLQRRRDRQAEERKQRRVKTSARRRTG